ncbi:pyridoxal phosphate-dependent aminotransferase [Planctomycetota bacterium]
MKFAARMSRLGQETAFEVLARAKALEAQGRDIIHLEIGEPDFDTPKHIVKAAKKAIDDGYTHYSPTAGLMEAREAVAEYISYSREVETDPAEVVITSGAKPIIWYSIIALCEQGMEIIYPNPGYPIYESVINFVHATPVPLQLMEEHDFRFDIEDLKSKISKRTTMLIINSPHNPTGGILTADDLQAIAELALKHDFWVMADEIYEKIIYDDYKFKSIYSIDGMKERTIILNGYSKTYAMTGWRLGYGIFPEALAEQITKLNNNTDSCTCSFTQIAGIAATTGPHDEIAAMVAEFKNRRDIIVDGLNDIKGFRCKKPLGAFYVFPNIEDTGWNSVELGEALLQEAGVACLAGDRFGKYGKGFLRFSYVNSVENIKEALKRIKSFVEG